MTYYCHQHCDRLGVSLSTAGLPNDAMQQFRPQNVRNIQPIGGTTSRFAAFSVMGTSWKAIGQSFSYVDVTLCDQSIHATLKRLGAARRTGPGQSVQSTAICAKLSQKCRRTEINLQRGKNRSLGFNFTFLSCKNGSSLVVSIHQHVK